MYIDMLCHSAFARVATSSFLVCLLHSRLCHSAFARVATCSDTKIVRLGVSLPQRIRAGCDFLRKIHSGGLSIFATAHSRGLRRGTRPPLRDFTHLCHSAFARVATSSLMTASSAARLCHSAFARVATINKFLGGKCNNLCHSAFARVATIRECRVNIILILCHSAFARVATRRYGRQSF